MTKVTRIIRRMEDGEPLASEELLSLVYEQLRRLARRQMQQESPGLTLQPTALVHEAYLRLTDHTADPGWNHRGHFFAAAAKAMRRILIENARRKQSLKGGGKHRRVPLQDEALESGTSRYDLIAIDEAMSKLEQHKPEVAELVSLRFFAGLSMPDAASSLGMSLRTAERHWTYAKAWLLAEVGSID